MNLLLVEDSTALAQVYSAQLQSGGFTLVHAATAAAARAAFADNEVGAVLIDLNLPDGDGIELLRHIRLAKPTIAAVVITANASIAKAVQAIREGAYDYLVKPVARDRLIATIERALNHVDYRIPPARSAEPGPSAEGFCGFVGVSPPMQALYRALSAVAASKAPVFIIGESGTGKELCAEAVHRQGTRAARPFVPINCGAIPSELMESEIFGHMKGSFTGAIADRDGAAKLAHGGTLFLDEICEMDVLLQTKLLRFLQTGMIQRVGSAAAEKVDVRVICATNREPRAEIAAGRFREDLYYRLHVLPVQVPPLRDRRSDIVLLANHFLRDAAREEAKGFEALTPAAESALVAHSWPGNVRELQNTIRQAVVLHDGDRLEAQMLHRFEAAPRRIAAAPPLPAIPDLPVMPPDLRQLERDTIENAIKACGGSIPKAARILGVSPSTLYRKRDAWHPPLHSPGHG
jgi:two-component system, repressor protein LuxO